MALFYSRDVKHVIKLFIYCTGFGFNLQVQRSNLHKDSCKEIYAGFRSCLTVDEATFLRECAKWRTWSTSAAMAMDRPDPAETLEESLAFASEQLYPSIRKCFMLLLVMPVSTATAERSFSTMRRVKDILAEYNGDGTLVWTGTPQCI
ncbi:hypothetical protein DPMN_024163 [Dreissena polymorpha]|uniref:HAT C-terminal dimerisation domain-containing protein n=1 Tax=Dreissena polymorpha TaxID=45954 RepID=A0A9D4LQW6_DREPO|nr:hypothetical protein DPMN_024163 [Dreissena polymorpha]